MATYILKPEDEVIRGTEQPDIFVGTRNDIGFDRLSGLGGNDTFQFSPSDGDGGVVDGGAGTDTVEIERSTINFLADLTAFEFSNVEVLSIQTDVKISISQLVEFETIQVENEDGLAWQIALAGAGGTLDLSSRLASGERGFQVSAWYVTSGIHLIGTAANDEIGCSSYADTIDAGAGNDGIYLSGSEGAARDTVYAGAGNDVFVIEGSAPQGLVDGGPGFDSIRTSFNNGSLLGLVVRNVELLETLDGVEVTIANLNAFKILSGGSGPNREVSLELRGAGGAIDFSAKIAAGSRLDFTALQARSGVNVTATKLNDTLEGSAFVDTLNGGAGNDTYSLSRGDFVIDTSGVDRIEASHTIDLARDPRIRGVIEDVTLTGNTVANALGNAARNILVGNYAANVLDGRGGGDTMSGGEGNDTYFVDNAADRAHDTLSGGVDKVVSYVSFNLTRSARTDGEIENLTLTGSAHVSGIGNWMANVILGNAGNNLLAGVEGNDVLAGGAGEDSLNGGYGLDRLNGGAGRDTFVFSAPKSITGVSNHDLIVDFSVADDTIQLENAVFSALSRTGVLAAGAFVSDTSGFAKDADDRIIYDVDSGYLMYDADGIGGQRREIFAKVAAGLQLTHLDFVVI